MVFKLEPINCICKALVENDESIRRTDDVFTGRDNGKRRMSSFHSSVSLDVTLHLFISSLNAGSKGGWGVVRIWSWKYQVTLNIEPTCHTKCIRIIVCCVELTAVQTCLLSIHIYHFFCGQVKLIFGLCDVEHREWLESVSGILRFHTFQLMPFTLL